MIAEVENKLNNVQLHLLKLFSKNLDAGSLNDVKELLSDYFYHKVVELADSEWDVRNYSNDVMDKWIYEESQ
ncbi:MAG: hypothetical protein RO257_03785 [Candidatus Kapabacteria bacterium]|nr:hypothetical protein [Candidatus Kapabacteria bacterium]